MSFPCGHPHWSRGVWSQLVVGVKGRWVKRLKTNLLKSKSPTDCHILKHAWPLRERRAAVVAAHPSNPWCWLASWDSAGDLAWTVIFLFGLHHPITKATRKRITLTRYVFSGRMVNCSWTKQGRSSKTLHSGTWMRQTWRAEVWSQHQNGEERELKWLWLWNMVNGHEHGKWTALIYRLGAI